MVTFLTIAAVVFGLIATFISVQSFPRWLKMFDIAINEADRRRFIKHAHKEKTNFEQTSSQKLVGNEYAIGKLWGLFKNKELSVPLLDRMHQQARKVHGLPPFSLQDPIGFLNEQRIHASCDEISDQIEDAHDRSGIRDLSILNIGLAIAAAISGLAAYFLS